MATRAPAYDATPLDVLLASVPSLPRAILARLTARTIARLDELDGDVDREPDDEDTTIDDEPCDGDTDSEVGSWAEDQLKYGTLHTYADDLHEDDDAAIRRPHCKRIRATRCSKVTRFGHASFHLIGSAADVIAVQP
jgi:hypothetical protein